MERVDQDTVSDVEQGVSYRNGRLKGKNRYQKRALVNMPPVAEKRIKISDNSKAIATAYRGFEFRSRLEGKWAVFFDLCEWPWSYEPVDFNGWIPDFAIGDFPTLVEVKPFFNDDEWKDTISKIVESGCKEDVILLGADATWRKSWYAPRLGWIMQGFHFIEDGQPEPLIWDLHFGFTEWNRKLGLCPMDGQWKNYIYGAEIARKDKGPYSNKSSRVSLEYKDIEKELVQRWAHACNVSQWIPTR